MKIIKDEKKKVKSVGILCVYRRYSLNCSR